MQHLRKLVPAVLGLAGLAAAQTQAFVDSGVGSVDKFGYSGRTVGDVDADGHADFIYSAPFTDANGRVNSGIVRVRSGRTGALLYQFDGPRPGDEYGYQVTGCGDVNADGHDDFVITVLILQENYRGACEVRSGADGSLLYLFRGKVAYDYLGISGSGAGDVDGDGFPDIVVGAPGHDANGSASGEVQVFSGKDGSELFALDGPAAGDQYGWFVDCAGDVDRDGYDDIVVGAPTHDGPNGLDSGLAQVVSGRTGLVLYTFFGATPGERFGWAVSAAGDVNKDGFDDVIVGGYFNDGPNGVDAGTARVFSGRTGAPLYTFYGDAAGDWFGWSVRDAGDVDADGYADVIVGATKNDTTGIDAGLARVYSGRTGAAITTLYGRDAGDWFGYAVGSVGDIDQNGYSDIFVGAIFDDTVGTDAGRAFVYTFDSAGTPPIRWHRGAPCAGSDGHLPSLTVRGFPSIGQRFDIGLRGAVPSASCLLNFGAPIEVPLATVGAPGCVGLADPLGFNVAATTDTQGFSSVQLDLPLIPALIGWRFDFQWIVRDQNANSLGFTFSNAAVIAFGG
ncbi:MAG: FG-GAP repeat protein [Planctomycetes bacterium]|nr:FG-GAP repeat protein [Planctomycetota bacterium]